VFFIFMFRNLLWGSVNYGQSLHGLHNTKSLRTPALGCTKICVRCITTKGFTRMHCKLVTVNKHFLQNSLLAKMNH